MTGARLTPRQTEAVCRRPSCVYPDICKNLDTAWSEHETIAARFDAFRLLGAFPWQPFKWMRQQLVGSVDYRIERIDYAYQWYQVDGRWRWQVNVPVLTGAPAPVIWAPWARAMTGPGFAASNISTADAPWNGSARPTRRATPPTGWPPRWLPAPRQARPTR